MTRAEAATAIRAAHPRTITRRAVTGANHIQHNWHWTCGCGAAGIGPGGSPERATAVTEAASHVNDLIYTATN